MIVEPGGARTGFANGTELADPMVTYDGTQAAYVRMISSGKVPSGPRHRRVRHG